MLGHFHNGDATDLSLGICGVVALLGLFARMTGLWP